jgi:hypothetical protein
MTVRIDVMDEDSAFDDLLLTNQTFQVGVHDTSYDCFYTGRAPRKAERLRAVLGRLGRNLLQSVCEGRQGTNECSKISEGECKDRLTFAAAHRRGRR